jgi:hypothetical protein
MELSEHMSLADLRSAIKMFKKDAPKLTSKKSDLMSFAQKVGIMKAKSEEKSEPVSVPVPAPKSKKLQTAELPEVLKKKVEPKVEPKVEKKSDKKSEPLVNNKKAAPSFAQFMSQHRGQGYSMKQLAEMFRAQRN